MLGRELAFPIVTCFFFVVSLTSASVSEAFLIHLSVLKLLLSRVMFGDERTKDDDGNHKLKRGMNS